MKKKLICKKASESERDRVKATVNMSEWEKEPGTCRG